MMEKNIFTREFKVGLTVVVASFILVYGIIWGKGYRLHTDKYKIRVAFDNVGGMVPGDPVMVNGVKEGKVISIDWQDRMVVCTCEINNRVQLYEDATFTIISAELLAGMKIEIFPGRSQKKINMSQQPFKGKYGGRIVDVGLTIDKLAADMSELTYRLDTTTALLNTMLRKGTLQQDIEAFMNNLHQISRGFRPLPDSLKKTLQELNHSLRNLNRLVERNSEPFNRSLQQAQKLVARLDTLSASLQIIMDGIEQKKGTLGKLVYDTELYDNLNKTLKSVDSLATQLKKKGVKVSLF